VKYKLGFYIPEDDILHSHRRENLKSYTDNLLPTLHVGGVAGQAASRRFPTAAVAFDPDSSQMGFVVDRAALGQVFSDNFSFSCHSFTLIIAPSTITIYHPGLV
jgi:hypothetical protein